MRRLALPALLVVFLPLLRRRADATATTPRTSCASRRRSASTTARRCGSRSRRGDCSTSTAAATTASIAMGEMGQSGGAVLARLLPHAALRPGIRRSRGGAPHVGRSVESGGEHDVSRRRGAPHVPRRRRGTRWLVPSRDGGERTRRRTTTSGSSACRSGSERDAQHRLAARDHARRRVRRDVGRALALLPLARAAARTTRRAVSRSGSRRSAGAERERAGLSRFL